MRVIPEKTVSRLLTYRSLLQKESGHGLTNIFSHQIADLVGGSSAQVRRDLMCIGYTGNPKNGYNIQQLTDCIDKLLTPPTGISMILVGVGNLGKAILTYFSARRPTFNMVAAFDADPNKTGRVICGCRIYPFAELAEKAAEFKAQVGVITVPASEAQRVADQLVKAQVKGLVNFAPARLKIPDTVYVENMDMAMTFEKVAYFSRNYQ
jgi:redox-sensing transcriptional repressor